VKCGGSGCSAICVLEEIFKRYAPPLNSADYQTARRLGRNSIVAVDVARMVKILAWKASPCIRALALRLRRGRGWNIIAPSSKP